GGNRTQTPSGTYEVSFHSPLTTHLLLALLRTHQLPRLGAEVPDTLLNHAAGPRTPPAVDLLVRLLEPAAGFRPVMFPFLLGQAFLRGKLGVSQGEHDPLSRVARAPLLQFAGLLQGLDAGLPVARPVVNPAQELPGHPRAPGKFGGPLGEHNRSLWIAQVRLGARGQNPGQVLVRNGRILFELDRLVEDGGGLGQLVRLQQDLGEEAVGDDGVVTGMIDRDGLPEAGGGLVQPPPAAQDATEVDVSGRAVVLLVEFDGPVVGGDGLGQLLLAMKDNANFYVDPGGEVRCLSMLDG